MMMEVTKHRWRLQVAEREAELLLYRNVVQGQKDLLEQQKKLQETTIKEFHDLDGYPFPLLSCLERVAFSTSSSSCVAVHRRYGTQLNQTYEELQQYCSELEAAAVPPCSRCNMKKGEKDKQQEDPIVQD